jgi:hypothetical protein
MEPDELVVGDIYFGLGYEDDGFERPIVTSYEYLGTAAAETLGSQDSPKYVFRFLGSEDRLELLQHQVTHLILDVVSLTADLQLWWQQRDSKERRK